jgi:hypothetical protein
MALTDLQKDIVQSWASNRSETSYMVKRGERKMR